MSRVSIALIAAGAGLAAAGLALGHAQAQSGGAAPVLVIRDFVGPVQITTRPGATLDVRVMPGDASAGAPARVETLAGRTIVDGGQRGGSTSCGVRGGQVTVRLPGGARRAFSDLPAIVVVAPPTLALTIERSMTRGAAGDLGAADLGVHGCSDLRLGRVAGALSASVAGGGRVAVGAVGGPSRLAVSGGGSLALAEARDVRAEVSGGGEIAVASGRGVVEAAVSGAGGFRHEGVAVRPRVSVAGGGDVRLAVVEGEPTIARAGAGGVTIGRRRT